MLQLVRAATFDELLSDEFDTTPGGSAQTELASSRLVAWSRSAAAGDPAQFERRLARDGLTIEHVQARFAAPDRRGAPPLWARDAEWIVDALHAGTPHVARPGDQRRPFDDLFSSLIDEADRRLWAAFDSSVADRFTHCAMADLRLLLTDRLCDLCAPLLFDAFRAAGSRYDEFIAAAKDGEFRHHLDDKPVLLRLIATLTRQWLDAATEFIDRLNADTTAVRTELLGAHKPEPVHRVTGGLSDPHCGGRTVLSVEFADGARIMYKPRDLRIDGAWHALVGRLNANAPIQLRAVQTLVRDGYGWSEFIEHTGCADIQGGSAFFRRAGAWLALLHCLGARDMHQENMIAAGEHPVPVDLETVLQPADQPAVSYPAGDAYELAKQRVADSVIAVGLLPGYGRHADDTLYPVGGIASDWAVRERVTWHAINTDCMRPAVSIEAATATTNLPHVAGRYLGLQDHVDDFIRGFREYAQFLATRTSRDLVSGFVGIPVRNVIRPTQFYSMLIRRLKNDRTMTDGVLWSVQADFLARLADWDRDDDPTWQLQHAERTALLALDVPRFVVSPDIARATARIDALDAAEIDWQTEVIRQTAAFLAERAEGQVQPHALAGPFTTTAPSHEALLAEADAVAEEIARHAMHADESAAWLGLGWSADSEVSQLTALGHDLYNGTSGIAVFLAAHAKTTRGETSAALARAAIAHVRAELKSRNAPHLARVLGIGGAVGLGSLAYALAVIGDLLGDADITADARAAANLITDDLIAADKRLDAVGGSAGAILGLLRVHRDTGAPDALDIAVKCAEHLLRQERIGSIGRRTWRGQGSAEALNGMSHGASGFAYALGSLAAATGRGEFADAALECVAFESDGYDAQRADWRDMRVAESHWRSQWCHGAVGIGLARVGLTKRHMPGADAVATDIDNALAGATRGWPGHVDTLCCGSLGSIELFREAGQVLDRTDLTETAAQRLAAVLHNKSATGDFRWNGGARRFNVGLFRGLAGVGYSCLRAVDTTLPNILIWD